METGFGSPKRDAQGACHVGQRHPEEVVQDDHGSPFGVEMAERFVEDLAVGDRGRHVATRRAVDRGQLDFDRPAPAPTRHIDARMDHELAQPGVELVRVAKRRQVPPGADKTFLDRITRELSIPEDQPGGCVESGDGGAGERGEGVMIALPCAFDEVSLVHDCPWVRARHSAALTW